MIVGCCSLFVVRRSSCVVCCVLSLLFVDVCHMVCVVYSLLVVGLFAAVGRVLLAGRYCVFVRSLLVVCC